MSESQLFKVLDGIGGAILMGVNVILPFLHAGRVRWGATEEELQRTWFGDELVPNPRAGFTHGITIHAPASQVYPWAAQIGQDKAGFYSYEFLENLAGCNMHNTYRLVPEWQQIKVGDQTLMHPQAGIPIVAIEPGHGYVLGGVMNADTGTPLEAGEPLPERVVRISWLFYAYDIENGNSRFISRWRVDYPPTFKNDLMFGRPFLEPVAHVMDVKMLKNIRLCAEGKKS